MRSYSKTKATGELTEYYLHVDSAYIIRHTVFSWSTQFHKKTVCGIGLCWLLALWSRPHGMYKTKTLDIVTYLTTISQAFRSTYKIILLLLKAVRFRFGQSLSAGAYHTFLWRWFLLGYHSFRKVLVLPKLRNHIEADHFCLNVKNNQNTSKNLIEVEKC